MMIKRGEKVRAMYRPMTGILSLAAVLLSASDPAMAAPRPVIAQAPFWMLAAEPGEDRRGFQPQAAQELLQLRIAPQPRVRQGEKIKFQIRSAREGYLLLIDINPGRAPSLIFPNQFVAPARRDGRVRVQETVAIPDQSYGFDFVAQEPFGRGLLLAIVTDQPFGTQRAISETAALLKLLPQAGSEPPKRGFVPQAQEQALADTGPLRETANKLLEMFIKELGPLNGRWIADCLEYEIYR